MDTPLTRREAVTTGWTSLWVGLTVLLALGLAGLVTMTAHAFVYDDAFITLRYAMRLAMTGELNWNPGERVEGFTNFLYTVWLAGLVKLGIDPLGAARASGLAAVALTALGAVKVATEIAPQKARLAGAMAFLVTLGTPALLVWGISGMEAPIIAACVVWTFWAMLPLGTGALPTSRAVLAGVICAVGYLTRMDAVVPLATLTGMTLLLGQAPLASRIRSGVIILGIVVVAIALQMAWRQAYYGEWLPNTYWAKVGVDRAFRIDFGTTYLIGALLQAPLLVLSGLAGLCALVPSKTRRPAIILLTTMIAQCGYVLWSGGDHLPVGRFLVAIVGVAGVLGAVGITAMTAPTRWAILIAAAVTGHWSATNAPIPMHGGAEAGLIVGAHVARTVPEGSLIALNVAGATPFVATKHRFVDMLGLNDAHISRVTDVPLATESQRSPGHMKGDGAYVLSRKPDIIIPGPADGVPIEDTEYLSGTQMAGSEEFARCYALRRERISVPGNDWMRMTGRGDTLDFIYYVRICD